MLIKKKNSSNKNNKIKITLGVIFLIIILVLPVTRKGVRYFFVTVFSPVVYVSHSINSFFYNFVDTFNNKYYLVKENARLNDELVKLNAHFSNYDELVQENQELKSAAGRFPEDKQFTFAAVLSKPPASVYDTFMIDGGTDVGMEIGQTVYVNGDVPIGTISSVFPKIAIVELYSSPSEKMDARLDPSHIDVTLFGHGEGSFLVSVPHDLVVQENSFVVSKEINPHVLGKLEKIISDPRDSSQTLIFSSPININEINFVEVEK